MNGFEILMVSTGVFAVVLTIVCILGINWQQKQANLGGLRTA